MNYNKIVIFDWGGIIESHRKSYAPIKNMNFNE